MLKYLYCCVHPCTPRNSLSPPFPRINLVHRAHFQPISPHLNPKVLTIPSLVAGRPYRGNMRASSFLEEASCVILLCWRMSAGTRQNDQKSGDKPWKPGLLLWSMGPRLPQKRGRLSESISWKILLIGWHSCVWTYHCRSSVLCHWSPRSQSSMNARISPTQSSILITALICLYIVPSDSTSSPPSSGACFASPFLFPKQRSRFFMRF